MALAIIGMISTDIGNYEKNLLVPNGAERNRLPQAARKVVVATAGKLHFGTPLFAQLSRPHPPRLHLRFHCAAR